MRTYQDVFRTPEFTPLFVTSTLQVAAVTVSGLALGTLVYAATGSPLLAALSMFGPSLARVLGAAVLLSAADRVPPRTALAGLAAVSAAGTAVQAVPGLPLWVSFVVLLALGALGSLGGGVRFGLLNQILAKDGYLLGRSVLNMAGGTMQICGFAVGGVLLTVLSPRGTLLAGAALYAVSAVTARFGLAARAARATGRPSVAATWRDNASLLASRPRRTVYLALWVPNGLIVGCESLFVPYSPHHAGLLFACAAVGMLAGDTLTGRFVPARLRERLAAPLRLLLAAPYLVFALHPALPLALVTVVLASVGYAASLMLQERLMELTPDELSGHALGLASTGTLAGQGFAAALAGAVAERTSPTAAMATMSVLSVAVTLTLAPGLRPRRTAAAAPAGTGADTVRP
ncbi:MFS transporter [Streptomyces sp. NPDC046759]|uniref:MFS transporter n=1 Tax=Streptomyces sp. NPDC046759 TaxID=3155019 RepID=UPI0033D7A0D3